MTNARRRRGPNPPEGAALTAPLAVALVLLAVAALALLATTLSRVGPHFFRSPLARDPAQFQFIAWSIARGETDYRDLLDMNAPLSHAVHWALMLLGGLDDGRFRRLELAALLVTAALSGALLPRRLPSWSTRLVAALCAAAAVVAEYLRSAPWHLSQRDAMALWFVLPALAVGAHALRGPAVRSLRPLAIAGALVGLAATLKPFFALFGLPLLAGALAALPREQRSSAARRLVAGGAAGLAPALLFTLWFGSLGDYLRIGFVEGPLFYRGLYDRAYGEILLDAPHPFGWLRLALVSSAAGVALVSSGVAPRRDLPLALAPATAAAVVLVQHKGFPYHVHLAAGTTLLLWVHALFSALEARPRAWVPALSLGLAGVGLAAESSVLLKTSGLLSPESVDYERLGMLPPDRVGPGPALGCPDYFPRELRLGAAWLAANTAPDARVFVYGHDIAVLLYARRRSATAALTSASYDLAGLLVPPRREQLSAARLRAAEAMQRRVIDDSLARLRRAPPEAAVLIDRSPWMTEPTALADVRRHAPALARWLEAGFVEAEAFGPVHVWRRAR